jgi:hypothetical protein
MGTELVSPFGAGSAVVPDDLVDKYRAEGWTVPENSQGPEDKPKARATRSTTSARKR